MGLSADSAVHPDDHLIQIHPTRLSFCCACRLSAPPRQAREFVSVFAKLFNCVNLLVSQRNWKRRRRARRRRSLQTNRSTSFATESSSCPGSMRASLPRTSGRAGSSTTHTPARLTTCVSLPPSPTLHLSRGKCSVALLNETESVLSYLDKEVSQSGRYE